MVDVILGLQWGDEGKGKIVDYFASGYDVITRFQGGPNAGHTLYIQDKKVVLHQVPSGVFHQNTINLIGNGVVLDVVTLQKECAMIAGFGIDVRKNLYLSDRIQLILPTHILLDKASEISKGDTKIGSTLKGIAPTYMDKTGRNGLRIGDILHKNFDTKYKALRTKHIALLEGTSYAQELVTIEKIFFEAIEFVRTLPIINGAYFINEEITKGKKILAEGAQGTMLDIDFGTFPFVTSSNTIAAGACTGLGIAPQKIREVIGVTKAYTTRVGNGPFPTELHNHIGEDMRKIGNEFGATTNRPRRCGWLDLVALRYATMINGVTKIVMTKIDVLDIFNELQLCTAYNINNAITTQMPYQLTDTLIEPVYHFCAGWKTNSSILKEAKQLPEAVKTYIQCIEKYVHIPISHLSNGPMKEQIIPL